MRLRLLLLAALALVLLPTAAAQAGPIGNAELELRPNPLELSPGMEWSVTGWVNATVQCEAGYTPSPFKIHVDDSALTDASGNVRWTIKPRDVMVELAGAPAPRFEAQREIQFMVGMGEAARGRSDTIAFEFQETGGGFPSQDCGLFGASWRFEGEPLTLRERRQDAAQVNGSASSPAAVPAPFNPADFVVDGGPIEGESHVPSEAFLALGTVFGAFAAYGVYEWRRFRQG